MNFPHEIMREESPLSQKVVRGGAWIFALRIMRHIFELIRIIILARILAPHDFGLLGIALLAIAILETFSQTGFQQALIQKKDKIEDSLNTAWTILIIRGLILFGILYLAAPFVASFFGAPETTLIIQVIGISILFQAFTNIGVIYFQKELEFDKQFIYQLSGTLADVIVAVSAALLLKNVWALVFGFLAGNFVRLIVSYLVHPWRPSFSLKIEKAKELFSFGKWILGSSVLLFLINQGDDLFVGKYLGLAALGFYQMAFRISNMPVTEITHIISQVSFPAYSKIQDDIRRLKQAYTKVLKFATFLSFPIAGIIFILAPVFTNLFLGEKWMPMVPAMRVLCIFAIARSIGATYGPLFFGANKPRFLTITTFIKFILLVILIYPLTKLWGITGTALATTIPVFISQSYGISRVLRILRCKLKEILMPIFIPFSGTLLIIAVFFITKYITASNITLFIAGIILGISVYLGFTFYIGKHNTKYNILEEVKGIIENFRLKGE